MANSEMGLLGRKLGMTQFFEEDGTVNGVTVVEVGPNTVLQVKSTEGPDGYNAIQVGFGEAKKQRTTKAVLGHLAKVGEDVLVRHIREIRLTADAVKGYEVGQTLGAADVFSIGDHCDATGTSKGRGFQGVMKKYNFAGFIRTHGTHEFFRHGGSIGTRLTPGHVLKGKKMPGQMGNIRVTVQNLKVVKVDSERNLVYIKGGVPGATGAIIVVRKAVKKG